MGRPESSRASSPRAAIADGSAILCRRQPGVRARAAPAHRPSVGGPPQTMAKRARGSTSTTRTAPTPAAPGRPTRQRADAAPTPDGRRRTDRLPDDLTHEEEARAAELEAAIVAQERQAETAQKTQGIRRATRRRPRPSPGPRPSTISAAEEYAYVARDVRRIAIVGGSLIVLLFALWVIAHVTGFGPF